MATYTSSQSGNFSATATWGGSGPPADGDDFNVASGHTVTIDSGISQPANGYNDSYVNGILKNDTSSNTELRMNGRLIVNSGGLLHLNDNNGACNFTMKIKGTSGNAHGIVQENAANANVVMEGKDGMPTTTLSTAEAENSTSLAFTSAADFAAGEWFAVFDNTTAQSSGSNNSTVNRDEGFVVHDIDSNTVYFRHFVGPDDCTVVNYSGSVLTVDRATVFRKGQYIIVGTGNSRTVAQINSINYPKNEITLSASVTGNPIGQTVYLTGTQKPHASGEKVRKVATIAVTGDSSSVQNYTVTVASGTNSYGTGNKYYIAGLSGASPTLSLSEGSTYRFDQSDSSNSGHPLRFSTTANGTHGGGSAYTTGVTYYGTPGTAGAYTQIAVPTGAPTLYYYCVNHSGMGGQADTPASGASSATLTVADATQFVANDEIWIAAPYTGSGSDTLYNAYEMKHTISSVSGNVLTLSSAPSYSVQSGAYVTRVTRHLKIMGTSSSDQPYFRGESYTTNYSRINIIKDVEFDNWGNTSNNVYAGLVWQGYYNSDASAQSITLTQTVPENDQAQWLEGVSLCFANTRDRSGIYFNGARYARGRCCFVYKGRNAFYAAWNDGMAFYNNIAAYNNNLAARLDGQRSNQEFAYNYVNRSYYGLSYSTGQYEAGFGLHHNIVDSTNHYGMTAQAGGNQGLDGFYCNDFKGIRYGFYPYGGATMLYSRVKEAEIEAVASSGVGNYGGTSQAGSSYEGSPNRGTFGGMKGFVFLEFNFEHDQVAQYTYYLRRTWDHDEQAWAVRRRMYDATGLFGTSVYVPAGVTVRVSCEVKIESGTTVTQYPRIQAVDNVARQVENRLGNATAGNTRFSSDRQSVFFTSACIGAFEEKQLTIAAVDHARHVDIGVGSYDGDDQEGFYMRDPIIRLDTPYALPQLGVRNMGMDQNYLTQIRNTFTQQKKRLGGRIR